MFSDLRYGSIVAYFLSQALSIIKDGLEAEQLKVMQHSTISRNF
jgi:hypothetical protein